MIIERIRQIIEYKGISDRQFCKEVGVANGFLAKVKDVGVAKVNKILYTYNDINPLWLLTGEGEMLKSTTPEQASATDPHIIDKLVEQAEEIGRLKAQVALLEKERGARASTAERNMTANAG